MVFGCRAAVVVVACSGSALRIHSPMLMQSVEWSHLDFAFISLCKCKPAAALQQRCHSCSGAAPFARTDLGAVLEGLNRFGWLRGWCCV